MIDLNHGESFVMVYTEDSMVDFRRDTPSYGGTIVINFADVGCLYYNNFYDYPLDGIGKNTNGYFRYTNTNTFIINEYEEDGEVYPYDVQEYTIYIYMLTKKQALRCRIENFLFCLFVGTACNYNKKNRKYKPRWLYPIWYKICRPTIKFLFG